MIKPDFLTADEIMHLTKIVKSKKTDNERSRAANIVLHLNEGKSFCEMAKIYRIDDDTVRNLFKKYQKHGLSFLDINEYKGSACELKEDQIKMLYKFVSDVLPRNTAQIIEYISNTFKIEYTTSGIIKLLNRINIVFTKPDTVSKNLNPEKQKNFIKKYNDLMKHKLDDEVVLFADAVHPTHQVKAVGCWAPKDQNIVIEQSSGRERMNIHGAINLETGETFIIEAEKANAQSTIALIDSIDAKYSNKRKIHLFLDNARYHHANLVNEHINSKNGRITLHFVPPYCPHLVPIERLWGVMHKNTTHNKTYAKFADFRAAILDFLCEVIPKNWRMFCDSITDNFRVIDPADFRFLTG